MNDELDLLQRATRALRDETAAPERRSGLTRARVLDAAAAKKRPLWRFIVPFALVLGTSTAFARVAFPEQLSAMWQQLVAPLRAGEPAAKAAPPKKLAHVQRAKPSQVAPLAVPQAELAVADVAAPEPRTAPPSALELTRKSAPAPKLSKAKQAPVLSVQPSSVPPAESGELMLFRRAERLHRAQHPEAIAAWDAYLRVAPSGVLVPEARYNRALALLRAGRRDEAQNALASFAAGDFGGYRAREARALIDQIAADAGRD
jgi:hypothetical protein